MNTRHLFASVSTFQHLTARRTMMMMMMMMMDSFMSKTLTLILVCMALQHACGLPLSEPAEPTAHTPAHSQHVRTKRCSCNSWDDKECIYFCHLDIIWVNTPSKLLPYGLGSPSSRRRRRSAGRCKCLTSADQTCSSFCQNSAHNPRTDVVRSSGQSENIDGNKLLASFRSVVKSNMDVAVGVLSSKKNTASTKRLKSRTRR